MGQDIMSEYILKYKDLNMKHVKHFTSSVQSYIIKLLFKSSSARSIRGHSLKKVILHLKTQEEAHVYMENNGRAARWNEKVKKKKKRPIMVQITHFYT